jgi:hypothetical protein
MGSSWKFSNKIINGNEKGKARKVFVGSRESKIRMRVG